MSQEVDPTRSHDPAAEVVDLCRDLIRIDSSNYGDGSGPGERATAEHVAMLLSEVGIEPEIVELAPGRTNVVARWGGTPDGRQDALLVHGHLDVVPAEASDWTHAPFAGEIEDGFLWGRGSVDMKDFDAMALSVVRARARSGRLPSRPVVLAFTADEEAGGHQGGELLVQQRPDLFEGCTDAVGEVGGFTTTVRGQRIYLIEAAERGMAWMKLRARGTAGHGSMVNHDNAVTRLAAAVARIGAHEWPVRLTPAMEVLLGTVGEIAGTAVTPENAESLVQEFESSTQMLAAVLRNTVNPTMLGAGYKVNVIPSEATAHLDGRFLPGYEDEFFATLDALLGPGVEREFVSHQRPWQSPVESDLMGAITRSILSQDPDARVAPFLLSAGTDGKHFGKLGITTYGFAPLKLPSDLDFGSLFHGVDERVPTESLEFGARVFDRFLDEA